MKQIPFLLYAVALSLVFGSYASAVTYQSYIGTQDINLPQADGVAQETFSRRTSTGGSLSLNKLEGNDIPWTNEYTRTVRPGNIITKGPWADVLAYGADPTGVADSTTAIQKAIDAVGDAGGGIVFFPVGTYLCNGNLTVNDDYVTLVGVGEGSVIQRGGDKIGWLINWATTANTVGGGLSSIKLLGDATLVNGSGGVRFGNGLDGGDEYTADRFIIHDVIVSSFSQYSVGIESGDNWDVRNVRVLDHGLTTGTMTTCIGFYVYPDVASTGGMINGLHSEMSAAAIANGNLNSAAIKLQAHQELQASNITAIGGSESCMVIDSISGSVRNVHVTPQGNNSGLAVINYSSVHSFSGQTFVLDGVDIYGTGANGFAFSAGDGTNYSLKGCTIRNVRSVGAIVTSLNNTVLQNCVLENWVVSEFRVSPTYNSHSVSSASPTNNVYRNIVVTGGSHPGVLAIETNSSVIENVGVSPVTGDTVASIDVTGDSNLIISPFSNSNSSNAIRIVGDNNEISNPELISITGRSIWLPSGSDNNIVRGGKTLASAGTGILDSGSGNVFYNIDPTTSADKGNADAILSWISGDRTTVYDTVITANRAVTLPTSGIPEGGRIRVVRTAAATGAFVVNVGTGPLKALAAGEWCEVEYDGSAWFLINFGAL